MSNLTAKQIDGIKERFNFFHIEYSNTKRYFHTRMTNFKSAVDFIEFVMKTDMPKGFLTNRNPDRKSPSLFIKDGITIGYLYYNDFSVKDVSLGEILNVGKYFGGSSGTHFQFSVKIYNNFSTMDIARILGIPSLKKFIYPYLEGQHTYEANGEYYFSESDMDKVLSNPDLIRFAKERKEICDERTRLKEKELLFRESQNITQNFLF